MKRLSYLMFFFMLHIFSRAETSSTINVKAMENLVFMAANIQGKWPDITPETLGGTTSITALDYNLDIIAIAQEISRQHGEEILAKLKDKPDVYCELTYKYAKYSNCPQSTKIKLLEDILQTSQDNSNSLIKGLAAFELLKYFSVFNPDRREVTTNQLVESLKKYKGDGVALNSYWRLLLNVKEQIKYDEAFGQAIKEYFPDDLLRDMDKATMQLSDDPNFFGVRLYYHEMYDTVPRNVREFWCRIWKCCR